MTEERTISRTNSTEINPSLPPNSEKTITFLKQFLLFSVSGITVTIFIILIGVWREGSRFYGNIQAFLNPTVKSDRNVEIPTIVVEQIKGTSELTTATFIMEAVVPASEDRKLGDLVVASTRLLYIARGEVRAGLDLNKISASDIKVSDNIIEIVLPSPEILDSKIDVDRSFVYDYDRGFMNLGPDAAIDLQTLAQRKTLRKIVKTACQKGLLTEANEKAKVSVSSLLNTAGYTKVKVITSPPKKGLCN